MVSVPSPISKWIKRQLEKGVPSINTESISASSATVDEAPSGESEVARKTEVDTVQGNVDAVADSLASHEGEGNPHPNSASMDDASVDGEDISPNDVAANSVSADQSPTEDTDVLRKSEQGTPQAVVSAIDDLPSADNYPLGTRFFVEGENQSYEVTQNE